MEVIEVIRFFFLKLLGVTPVLTHWSYVFLALTHQIKKNLPHKSGLSVIDFTHWSSMATDIQVTLYFRTLALLECFFGCKPHKTYQICYELEQLERLRSENTPRCPMITHTMHSYQIPCHNKTKSKLQIPKICQKLKFSNFTITLTCGTPS